MLSAVDSAWMRVRLAAAQADNAAALIRHLCLRIVLFIGQSGRAAYALRKRGVEKGDRVLLVLPTGPSFLAAFYGCQVLGAIPVPVVPPFSLARMEEHLEDMAYWNNPRNARAPRESPG